VAAYERRKAQTRREIAEHALALFMRNGYSAVGADAIADAAGVSLRTFYRYFSGKDEVLVPIVSDSVGELVDRIAAQPVDEPLSVAVERAVEAFEPRLGDEGVAALAQLLGAVPALSARVGLEFAALEERMVALVRERAVRDIDEEDARVTAAIIVLCLRIALRSVAQRPPMPFDVALHRALRHAQAGAGLAEPASASSSADAR
jgi:AcrR family transcriptional regulator